MVDLIKALTLLDGTSGDEGTVRDFIIKNIDGFCEWKTDVLGNIIAFKKGEKRSKVKLMLDAHTDEVGLIITNITADGFLKFKTVGGIETESLMFRRVLINGNVNGVIGGKPIHLLSSSEGKKLPKPDTLYIDIGAKSLEEAKARVNLGDRAVMCSEFCVSGGKIKCKALDDRIGCAILIELLRQKNQYDFYATFSVQEEVGVRGARVAAYTVNPDAAIILESTTAADIAGVSSEKQVCVLGKGAAVSFMDRATVYDRSYYNAALASGVSCQPKCAVTGGNNSAAVHLNRSGVRTLAISVPCRYIHSASSVADVDDIVSAKKLAEYMINGICGGEIS